MSYGISIKPLSANQAYRGKKIRTGLYSKYRQDVLNLLPRNLDIPEGKLAIKLEFGFSSAGSDADNAVKPFVDILQAAYEFNDNQVYHYDITKKKTSKGAEYIIFSIEPYVQN